MTLRSLNPQPGRAAVGTIRAMLFHQQELNTTKQMHERNDPNGTI
jgi:hypothetical protein